MKKLLFLTLNLFPLILWAQTASRSIDTNALFDKAVRNDSTWKITRSASFPKSEFKKSTGKLTYSKILKLWDNNLKDILDDTLYPEADKIKFIKDALADTSQDAFEYINNRSIRFWRSSKEATGLIEGYFKAKAFERSNNPDIKYKYFEFRTKNLLPDAYRLITEYFNKRPGLTGKYPNEGDLVCRLIQLGKKEEAVRYLEILIRDFLQGNIKELQLGDREKEGIAFDLLCLSDNAPVAKKATDLLFELLESKDYETYKLYQLTSYLDKARHLQLLSKRFEHFATIDFSPLDTIKKDWATYQKLVPEGSEFFLFMTGNAVFLGEAKGREMWKKFVETMPYWELYNQSIEASQIRILENAFRDPKLTVQEMRTMLFQCKRTERFYTDRDYHGEYKGRFLRCLIKAYPDRKVPKDDFDKLQLQQILEYSMPLHITEKDLVVNPFRTMLAGEQIDTIVHDINKFAKSTRLGSVELSNRERFNLSLVSPQSCLFNYFVKNKRMVAFDNESADIPADYVHFYKTEFQDILERAGINLCLMQKKSLLRLVEMNTDDQTANFVLMEPRKVKPLLDKYGIANWAISYEDDFYYAGK